MATLLIVEDDKTINGLMVRALSVNGHQCLTAFTGSEALSAIKGQKADLVLLDINLPDMDGFWLAGQLGDVPVIYVTARSEIHDRVRGLDGGAEDYIVKPFHIQELISRVHVVLRRYQKEFELLKALIYNKNITLTREQLLDAAWGWDYEGEDRTVDVHIQRLRKKLSWEKHIKTIYKTGYRLEA